MNVIIIKPNQNPEVIDIPNTLKAFQEAVGGYIETVSFPNDLIMIVNEEGKLNNLPFNFYYYNDYIVGNALIVGNDGEEFRSLTEEEIQKVFEFFD